MVWIFVLSTMIPSSLKAQDKWDGETVATKFFSGTGTQSNPYIIRTGAEIAYFLSEIKNGNAFENKYIRLGNDIIFDSEYQVSGSFAGDFDGNRHYLSSVYGPFIQSLSGSIHDLKIDIHSLDYGKASIVGTNTETGHVYNCYIITNSSPYTGGLAALAYCNDGIIENCYATGRIHGKGEYGFGYQIAALVYNNTGTLKNCASEVKVTDYASNDKSSNLTYTNTGSVINCFRGKNNIATMFDVTGTTCTIEYIDTMGFVNLVSSTISKGQQIGNLPQPNYDCTFIGWYRNGELVKETDVVNNNWTLFAKWEQRIQKQPTKEDMSIRVDDSQHASYKWYMLNSMPIFFADWQSTNHGYETTSSQTYTFENCKNSILTFHYNVSSESCDHFTATLNGNVLVNTGGNCSKDYSYVIPDNGQYTLTLSYSKDDSESEGKDMVEVSNIMVSPAPQLIASNVTAIQIDPTIEAVYYCNVTYSNSGASLISDYVMISQPTDDISTLADAIYIEPFSGRIGDNVDIEVKLKNAKTVTSYGFELVLPKGMSINVTGDKEFDNEVTLNSDRHNNHTVSTNKLDNGNYKIAVASMSSKAMTGNDGLVLTVKASINKGMALGKHPIKIENPLIVYSDATKPTVMPTQTTITIEDYMKGDVDGDGVVDLADAVLVINHYVGKPVNKFVTKAADVDGDGVVDLADAVRIINFYVGKVQSLAPSLDFDGLDPQ